MPQTLTTTEVEKIAKLARLEITDTDKEKFASQLSSILDYVGQLQEVNTDGVEPAFQVENLQNMTREDVVEQLEIQEELIACSPESDGRLIKVKNVL